MTENHPTRLPAYGRSLLAAQRQGLNVPWLLIALDWNLGRTFPRVVVSPDTQARELDLRLARGLACMVAHRSDPGRALDVAESALKYGARLCPVYDVQNRQFLTTAEVCASRGLGVMNAV